MTPAPRGDSAIVADLLEREAELALHAVLEQAASAHPVMTAPAERRVAANAAEGCMNREIARWLFLSLMTVEMHLRSAYRELDLAGRAGLAGALR